jgi:putative DNA methylase
VAKTSSKKTGNTKKELLDEAFAEAVEAGRELHLESVDFSDPNRPKTCLEVDFPILLVNGVAALEASSGAATKPVYQMSKWWARRPSSVFRSLLIAAATKAPDNHGEAAKLIWDSYYGNHQKNAAFQKLKVADIFMGGGTTVVEGARLGMQMYGNDLNPVAWFITKNELAHVDPTKVQKLLDHIETEVKPQIMPFYACDCPHGHKGKWTQKSTGEIKGKDFDPLSLKPEQRADYKYEGPEIIFTFWAKHGPCQATGCDHRTPIMSSPVIAVKTLTVKAWLGIECGFCKKCFDVEEQNARISPAALFVISPDETPFTLRHENGSYNCPHCGHDATFSLGTPKNKKVDLTLLIHPDWLKGSSGKATNGSTLGGRTIDDSDSTAKWYAERQKTAKLIEVRGSLPKTIACPDTGEVFETETGTVPRKSTFTCMEATCGKQWDVLEAVKATKTTGPTAPYAFQCYCPFCDETSSISGGRFISPATNCRQITLAAEEWDRRKSGDLNGYWPTEKLFPYERGNTSMLYNQPGHGITHWWMMFNPRQLLVHALLLRALDGSHSELTTKDFVFGGLLQYLRYNCTNTIWHLQNNQISAFFSNNNYQVRSTHVETSVYSPVGDGSLSSSLRGLEKGLDWLGDPWELVNVEHLSSMVPSLANRATGKSVKVYCNDPVKGIATLQCNSSTNLSGVGGEEFDCVVTDPPFGGLLHYADMADFFYVWLRIWAKKRFPEMFASESTPRSLEVIANRALEDDPDAFYQRLLTECWREVHRSLKPGGILAFTFHHSDDEPWVAVLESLFRAGFYLEATYPIRSDETKGEGSKPGTFGSQQIEFDIIHVCRKRMEEPQEISWARLRRQILSDVRQLQDILEHHQQEGLQEADLQVIRRGKALEYYSKHYGKVYVEKGREFTVKEALTGINQLLDDQRDSTSEVPPLDAEPYTRQFLRLFRGHSYIERGQLQKFLRGTGVSPAEFVERGWCYEEKKIFYFTPPLELAQKWKGVSRQGMGRDFDQAMFLIGACYQNSGIRVQDTLNSEKFLPHPATGDVIDWFTRHGGDALIKDAAKLAKQLYTKWVASNQPKVKAAQRTFDFAEEA